MLMLFHIKWDLMNQFVNAFSPKFSNFPKPAEAKIQAEIFEGPQITKNGL